MVDDALNRDEPAGYRSFPWLRLTATIRKAMDLRKLAIAAVGLVFLRLGWAFVDVTFPITTGVAPNPFDLADHGIEPTDAARWIGDHVATSAFRISEPIWLLTTPLRALFNPESEWATMLRAFVCLLWLMLVWGLCGGAIARIAVVQEARLRQPRIGEGLAFAWRSAGRLFVAPLCPLIAIGLCCLVGAGFGVLYRLPSGEAIAGVGLVVPLVAGLVMTLLLAYLVASWPLLHAAIAAGADDPLDALSRTFSYLNQRVGDFIFGVLVAGLAGVVGLFVVDLLTAGVLRLTEWSLALSAPRRVPAALFQPSDAPIAASPRGIHQFWLGVVRLLAHGWVYSFFWTVAAILYLWLRHDVDGTPWTEIDPPAPNAHSSPASAAE